MSENILIHSEEEFQKVKAALMGLDINFFPQSWKEKDWSDVTPGPYLIIIDKVQLRGFLLCSVSDIDSQAHLLKIVVKPNHRGFGLGEKLLMGSVGHLSDRGIKRLYLEVSTDNVTAISLYEKLGFKKLILKKKFYSNGSDAYAMSRDC